MKGFLKAIKKTFKVILVIYLFIVICITLFYFYQILIKNAEVSIEVLYGYLIVLLVMFIFLIMFIAPFVSWYLMIKLGNDIVDKIDGSEYKNLDNHVYYRDVPKDYNPAVASLILNIWLEKKTDMNAMILYFIKNKYLKKDGNTIFYTGKDTSDLEENEKYFLESYSKNIFKFNVWRNLVVQEAKNKGYVEELATITEEKDKRKDSKYYITVFMYAIIFIVLNNLIPFFALLLIPIILFGVVLGLIYLYRRTYVNIKLTEKGIEEQEKLVKLKRYLAQFNELDNLNEDAIVLWEDYLVYAVALGVNENIVENSKIYNRMNNGEFNINQQIVHELYQNTNNNIRFKY